MTKKIITFGISLVLAFALWLYVVTVVGPEYEETFRDIPVVYQGASALEARNLMILGDETHTVDLKLSGNRRDLNKLSSSNISVTLDLSKILDPGKTSYRYDISYPGNVANDSVTVQSQSPTGITLEIVRSKEKKIPVHVSFDEAAIAEGYGFLPVEQELTEIQISGPESVVDQITQATVALDINQDNNKSDITGEYVATLCDAKGQQVDSRYVTVSTEGAEAISVTLPVRMKKVLPLTVQIVEGGGATEANSTITISPSTITVLGKEEDMKDLQEISLGEIDLRNWTVNTESMYLPIELPEGLTNKSGVTEAMIMVELPELQTKDFVISRDLFQTRNLPAGTYPEISTEQLIITVRGTKNALGALTEEMLRATIDLSDAKIGQMKDWTVDVQIIGQPDGVGIIGGPYTVWIEIMDAAKVVQTAEE